MTPLRERMIGDMQRRNYAPGTIRGYVDHVAGFAHYFGRSPEHLGLEEIRTYHRVAISNDRLLDIEGGQVRFRWKNYAAGGQWQTMTLSATEFIRRFFLHVLPSGFVRIRYYGFLAHRHCQARLRRCRELLGVSVPEADQPAEGPPNLLLPEEFPGEEALRCCPVCRVGHLITIQIVPVHPALRRSRFQPCDTS